MGLILFDKGVFLVHPKSKPYIIWGNIKSDLYIFYEPPLQIHGMWFGVQKFENKFYCISKSSPTFLVWTGHAFP